LFFSLVSFRLLALLVWQKAALGLVTNGQILIELRDFQMGFRALLGNSFSPKQVPRDQCDRPQDGETDQNGKDQKKF
jgi:hypothetical protein